MVIGIELPAGRRGNGGDGKIKAIHEPLRENIEDCTPNPGEGFDLGTASSFGEDAARLRAAKRQLPGKVGFMIGGEGSEGGSVEVFDGLALA